MDRVCAAAFSKVSGDLLRTDAMKGSHEMTGDSKAGAYLGGIQQAQQKAVAVTQWVVGRMSVASFGRCAETLALQEKTVSQHFVELRTTLVVESKDSLVGPKETSLCMLFPDQGWVLYLLWHYRSLLLIGVHIIKLRRDERVAPVTGAPKKQIHLSDELNGVIIECADI